MLSAAFGRGFRRLIPTVWQTHPSSGLWAWPRCWWPGFTILAGAVKSQHLTVLPRPRVILWSSGKCPFRSPWITSFQRKSHNIFTFTSMDAVSYVKNFCAIHCPFFSSALPSLSCRSQSCTQTFTCGHIIAMAHWYPLFPLLLFLISLWLFLTSSNQQTNIFLEVFV